MFSPVDYLKEVLLHDKIVDQASLDQIVMRAEADDELLTDHLIEEGIVGEGVDQCPLGAAGLLLDAVEVAPVPVAHRLHELPVLS